MSDLANEFEQQRERMLGHGMIAVMFGIADTNLKLTCQLEIDIAGDSGTAEHDALDMALFADRAQ